MLLYVELCRSGVDQRDQYYFLALGYYKLEVFVAISCLFDVTYLSINRIINKLTSVLAEY